MRRVTTLILLIFAILPSCKKKTATEQAATKNDAKIYTQIKKADWLLGNWQNKTGSQDSGEIWKKASDSVYKGKSYVVKDGTINFTEFMTLTESNGKLVFAATVPNQNSGGEVPFEATAITTDSIVFENPKHDFPNRIVYNKVGEDSLVAVIYGIQNNKPVNVKFRMKKSEKINEHERRNNNSSNLN